MRRRIIFVLTLILLFVTTTMAADHQFTLVIDAGHGGHDTGAAGAFSKEKDINLSVALAFGEYVEKNCPDVKVIYTRKTDVFIPLKERAGIANRNNADLFISVHTNALPGGAVARGFETYTLGMHRAKDNLDVAMRENSVISMEKGYKQNYEGFDPKSSESYIMFEFIQGRNMEKSVDLAKMIQSRVCKNADRPDKGVHQAGFLVLRETSMPSCLIELGFITTSDEETALNDESKQRDIGKAIYKAFRDYKEKYGDQITVPYLPDPIKAPSIPTIVPAKTSSRDDGNVPQPVKRVVKKNNGSSDRQSGKDKHSSAVLPVFKVQFLATKGFISKGDERLKGVTDFDSFQESGLYKWTVGASSDYNVIYKLRKEMLDNFPEAFIVAFKNGEKVDVIGAIKEYLASKGK
nr:N-acetylmuramoyl-L-alanine amidase [Prevotella sp.]